MRAAADAPASAVLVYDGNCGFCTQWADRIARWDRRGRIRMVPLQAEEATALTGRTAAELDAAMHLVLPSGAVHAGAAAAREVTGLLPGGRWLRLGFSIPGVMPVAERVYRWVAARRYGAVGCRGGHCRV